MIATKPVNPVKKREKRKAKNNRAQLGFCHGCGKGWTKLTYEHVPPKRVQLLIPQSYIRFNPIDLILKGGAKVANKKLPPYVIAHGGLKVKSFGECCQQLTQLHYGQAFYDWTRAVLEMCKNIPENEDRVQATVEIEPLAVIKQITAIALAAAEFNPRYAELRRFVCNPDQTGLPSNVEFYAYLNPLRPDSKLPQCRLNRRPVVASDIVTGYKSLVFAEVSVPPLGYVILHKIDAIPHQAVQSLMCLNHFASVAFNRKMPVALDIPVRTPFGAVPLQYLQDATTKSRQIKPISVS
jgi:hypothetical protein